MTRLRYWLIVALHCRDASDWQPWVLPLILAAVATGVFLAAYYLAPFR
jgi:hypothetical protein